MSRTGQTTVARHAGRARSTGKKEDQLSPDKDALVEDAPELGRTRSAQNCLPGQTGGYLLVEVVQVAVGAGAEDRAGVALGLQ